MLKIASGLFPPNASPAAVRQVSKKSPIVMSSRGSSAIESVSIVPSPSRVITCEIRSSNESTPMSAGIATWLPSTKIESVAVVNTIRDSSASSFGRANPLDCVRYGCRARLANENRRRSESEFLRRRLFWCDFMTRGPNSSIYPDQITKKLWPTTALLMIIGFRFFYLSVAAQT